MDFQHRVAAWVAVHILAEKGATPPWNLPEGTTLEWLRCETDQPVDDLLVETSANGRAFTQIKRTLRLSRAPDSDLASGLSISSFANSSHTKAKPPGHNLGIGHLIP